MFVVHLVFVGSLSCCEKGIMSKVLNTAVFGLSPSAECSVCNFFQTFTFQRLSQFPGFDEAADATEKAKKLLLSGVSVNFVIFQGNKC